jgi:hypothetical protein
MCRPIHYYVQTNGVVGFGGLSLFLNFFMKEVIINNQCVYVIFTTMF